MTIGMRAVKRLFAAALLALSPLGLFAHDDASSVAIRPAASAAVATNASSHAVKIVVTNVAPQTAAKDAKKAAIAEDGSYTSREQVALYLRTYRKLPKNFMTKAEARRLGWVGGPLEPFAPGKSIGGDHFGNYERKLPFGRYRECDIDTRGRPRGSKRIIYTEDAKRIYYTDDHYRTFQGVP